MPASTRNRETTQQDSCNPEAEPTQKQISEYELSREERIKENLERMRRLGILDLSHQLRSSASTKRTSQSNFKRKTAAATSPAPVISTAPPRRSSRLQNATPVSYSELPSKMDNSSKHEGIIREEGPRPEFYTEEHERLLGSTERSWELFVDGYGKDGKRIYDQIKGKTCHQCRQKTLGHRTSCSNCNMVQGQFCGDCLYMRYGEHVLEAKQNPNWICPPCRGICNCSLCRTAKGWAPTGCLYKKIISMGYKSVAHYLIQTKQLCKNKEEYPDCLGNVPVKRSLPFSDMEPAPNQSSELNEVDSASLDYDSCPKGKEEASYLPVKRPLPFSSKEADAKISDAPIVSVTINDNSGLPVPELEEKLDESKDEKEKVLAFSREQHNENQTPVHQKSGKEEESHLPVKRPLCFTSKEAETEISDVPIVSVTINDNSGMPEPQLEEKLEELRDEKEKDLVFLDEQHNEHQTPVHHNSGKKRKHYIEPNSDSIGGRLRLRRRSNGEGAELSGNNQVCQLIHLHTSNGDMPKKEVDDEIQMNSACKGNIISNAASETNVAAQEAA